MYIYTKKIYIHIQYICKSICRYTYKVKVCKVNISYSSMLTLSVT